MSYTPKIEHYENHKDTPQIAELLFLYPHNIFFLTNYTYSKMALLKKNGSQKLGIKTYKKETWSPKMIPAQSAH